MNRQVKNFLQMMMFEHLIVHYQMRKENVEND